jgi:hypothetical protein
MARIYSVAFLCLCYACVSDDKVSSSVVERDASVADAAPDVDSATATDAAADASAPTCTDMTSIQSCGPSCSVCKPSNGGAAICDGKACGLRCVGNAPLCTNGSCSRLRFDFSSNTKEGVLPESPSGLALAVRPNDGDPALAFDVQWPMGGALGFTVPICVSGTQDVSSLTMKMRVNFKGGNPNLPAQYYITGSLAAFQSNSNLPVSEVTGDSWITYTAALGQNAFSGRADTVTIQLGSSGALFSGTVWVDDIEFVTP